MPQPQHVRDAALAKRQGVCIICGASFLGVKRGPPPKSCPADSCRKEMRARIHRGRVHSEETKAKRNAANKARWADPVRREQRLAAATEGREKWLATPGVREKISKRSSAWMTKLHQDPEFQKHRDIRSSRVMKENWVKYRERFTDQSVARYADMAARGFGLCSEESKKNQAVACKWIMKKAQEALHLETDFDQLWIETQARLRREHPYDGPQNNSDYMDYLGWLGKAAASDPQVRDMQDGFMAEAIPRFSAEWNKRKAV